MGFNKLQKICAMSCNWGFLMQNVCLIAINLTIWFCMELAQFYNKNNLCMFGAP
jgi:hypothetical protein